MPSTADFEQLRIIRHIQCGMRNFVQCGMRNAECGIICSAGHHNDVADVNSRRHRRQFTRLWRNSRRFSRQFTISSLTASVASNFTVRVKRTTSLHGNFTSATPKLHREAHITRLAARLQIGFTAPSPKSTALRLPPRARWTPCPKRRLPFGDARPPKRAKR